MTALPLPFTGAALDLNPPVGFVPGIFVTAVAVAFLIWLYRRELRLASGRVAVALLALRGLALLAVLVPLAFDPVIVRTVAEPVPGRVIVAFDRSDSMRVTDPQRPLPEKLRLLRVLKLGSDRDSQSELVQQHDRLTRLDVAVRASAELLDSLREKHTVETMAFDQASAPLPADVARVPPAGPSYTDLKQPLERAAASDARLLGVVVLTDGRHNWGETPLALARELGQRKVPVYPVLVAPEVPPPDVAVASVRPQATTAFKGSVVPVEVEVRVVGWPAGPVTVSLESPPVTQTIDHAGRDEVYRLALKAKLDEVGPQTLKVTAGGTGREDRFPVNNAREARVNVVRDRARVLLIDGDARWEFHYLHTLLGRDENLDVRSVVFRQPRVTRATDEEARALGLPARELPADPDALAAVDCVILGDVEPSQLPPAERDRLERYVADAGGTLVMVAGKRAMPLAYAGNEDDPLRKLLPVRRPKAFDESNGFPLALTPDAERAWFVQLADSPGDSREAWERLPPHYWAVPGEAKDGAEVLAAVNGKPPREAAVIVRQNYGFGRVLYVGLDSTWRWRFKVGDRYHHRFWGQVAQWAASDRLLPTVNAAGTIRFGTREPALRAGRDGGFVVRATEAVRALSPRAIKGVRVVRLPDGPTGKESPAGLVPLSPTEGRPRELTATLRDLAPGQYAAELEIPEWADQLRGSPGPDGRATPLRARFEVLPPDGAELVDLSADRVLLEQIAAASGGKVYAPETVAELSEMLASRAATREEQVRSPARQSWWLLGLVAALLTAEWVLRKWTGLP
jgi:hypothetical protein